MKHIMRLLVFLIDATGSFFIYLIVAFIISYTKFLPFFRGFFFIWVIYYIVCYLIWRRTLGQTITNHSISDSGGSRSYAIRIILREVLTSVPGVVILTLGWGNLSIIRTLSLSLICCIIVMLRKKLFKISIIKKRTLPLVYKRAVSTYFILLIVAFFARALNAELTYNHSSKESFLYARPRPSANSVKVYADFLKNNRQDINDYILGLFEQYDHVILCERAHREMTQYDMIYNLVTDPRFVDEVGNVFTEIGNVESRDAYKAFVGTNYANESAVDSCLSSFMVDNQSVHLLWPNTNWFEFLKKMYYFNNNHDKKVEILFSDRNWIERKELNFRDSIMADNIINTIKSDSINKSLIIMNYRHAYLTPGNCGYFVSRSFPGKVANVLINTCKAYLPAIIMGKEMMVPIQDGKWDVAFEQIPDSCYAFDLKSSPFGNDRFDHFVLPWDPVSSLKYEDVFTGFIFYKSLDNHIMSIGYPNIFDSDNLVKLRVREKAMEVYSLGYWIESLKDGVQTQKGIDFYNELNLIENKVLLTVFILGVFLFVVSLLLYGHNSKSVGVRD